MMANDPSGRAKLTLDTMASPPRTPPNQIQGYSGQSPGASFFTPTSAAANYSTVPGGEVSSPYFVSPASSTSGYWGDRVTPRRLSFPSGVRPFDMPQPATYPPPYSRAAPPHGTSFGAEQNIFASPSSAKPADESMESDWRRRTWHPSSPSTFRPGTSGLWFSQTTSESGPPAASQPPRLPGIESFDQVTQRPSTPPRRQPTPMQVDQPSAPPPAAGAQSFDSASSFHPQEAVRRSGPPVSGPGHRRGAASIDTTLQRTLTKLDLHGEPSNDAPSWTRHSAGDFEQRQVVNAPHPGSMQAVPVAVSHPPAHVAMHGQPVPVPDANMGPYSVSQPRLMVEAPHPMHQSEAERRQSYVPPSEYFPKVRVYKTKP
jgi:hypothetical protein